MIYPSLDDLMKNVDSKYTLVMQVAKRARQLAVNPKPLVSVNSDKPVTIAIHEVSEKKIKYRRTKEGIK